MKVLRLLGIALLSIFSFNACSDLLGESDTLGGSDLSQLSIRPVRIDLNGVTGFAVIDNYQTTKTNSETSDSVPQALYNVDENGDIKLSIFYFEVEYYDGNDNANVTKVQKEISDALQIMPSLITDLGKYLYFSGCTFQILNPDISDNARNICEQFINNNQGNEVAYLIRKSDGAIFNFVEQYYFTYYNELEDHYFPCFIPGSYIPEYTFHTSTQNNLFIQGNKPVAIFKIEDNGDAVDVMQMTQELNEAPYNRFAIDADENIYICEYMEKIQIYYAWGGYDIFPLYNESLILDLKIDDSGTPYVFYTARTSDECTKAICYILTDGDPKCIKEETFTTSFSNDGKSHKGTYLGYYADCYNWCDFKSIMSYNIKTNEWSLRNLSSDMLQLLSSQYNAIVFGSKTYCVNVKGNSIEVTEIDLASEMYRTYSLNADIPSMVQFSVKYSASLIQGIPYLTITGLSKTNGASVRYTIDIINGTDNSSFAPDGRNVVSFFRIN